MGCVRYCPGRRSPPHLVSYILYHPYPLPQLLTQGGGVTLSSESLLRE